MEKPDRIINLLFEGIRPSKIAVECGISEESVASQIIQAIQQHRIPRLQVLATLSKDLQNQIAMFFPAWIKKPHTFSPEFIRAMSKASDDDFDLSEDEILVYLVCFEKPFRDGGIYEALCDIERTLHEKTKMILMNKFGSHENGWWRKGVPENVRISTVQSRERDLEFVGDAPYSYTTLINLKRDY